MERVQVTAHNLVKILSDVTGKSYDIDEEESQMYNTFKDTFNAFDRDGNAELQFPEYLEAWKCNLMFYFQLINLIYF